MRYFLISEDQLNACDQYNDWSDEYEIHRQTIEDVKEQPISTLTKKIKDARDRSLKRQESSSSIMMREYYEGLLQGLYFTLELVDEWVEEL